MKYHQRWGGNKMEKNERYAAGLEVMEELFSEEVRGGMKQMKEVSPDLWELIVSFGFGDLYARNTLILITKGNYHTHDTDHARRFRPTKSSLTSSLKRRTHKRGNHRNHHPLYRICRISKSCSSNGNRWGNLQTERFIGALFRYLCEKQFCLLTTIV